MSSAELNFGFQDAFRIHAGITTGITVMKQVVSFLKQVRLDKILLAFIAGLMLLSSVACANTTEQGARPHNPPVQAGGANNPYKGGGDGYTQYKQPSNPVPDLKPNA